ncbi:MAG TPA: AMP-binding protein [Terriglobales bacterium]|nr:AMP-binding protein [Terriglobales bacterium]
MRTQLHADPAGVFLHNAILEACHRFGERTAVVDTSCSPPARLSYAGYGTRLERLARGLVAASLRPGEVVAIYLANSWEFALSYHAVTLAGGTPTLLNPSYREREVRYQLENSGAVLLITDGPLIQEINLAGLPALRRVYLTRSGTGGEAFYDLLRPSTAALPAPAEPAERALAALPYSSGTTGLPKGVMLTHTNLVANAYQYLAPGERATYQDGEVVLDFLPLYHIYGLNVVLSPALLIGGTLVLMPRFDLDRSLEWIAQEGVTFLPMVPPCMNAFCQAAEQGRFPREHRVRAGKSGAAPLAPDLPKRFTQLTGIPIRQGYGMTEASPVTHMGYTEPELYRPDSIGPPLARTECRIVSEAGADLPPGQAGELVMRGPQFMLGYWKNPEATAEVLREGWYWSGDVASRDAQDFYFIVDRRKEMIKYKGFPVAPAEVEAVLLEHPAVRDCGVVPLPDRAAGEIPCAFIVLRDGGPGSAHLAQELSSFVAERLTGYKQPREVRFVASIPRNPSGKILRRNLRDLL